MIHIRFRIHGMQRLPRVVRADAGTENVITRELQIFSEDAIPMKFTRKKVSHWNSNQRIEMFFFMKTFSHFWRNLFKHLRDSVFYQLLKCIYFILCILLYTAFGFASSH